MTDDEMVRQTARKCLQWDGPSAAERLRERAEIADGMGDMLSAEAWRDIADAAELLVCGEPDPFH